MSCLTFGGFRARSGRLNGMAPRACRTAATPACWSISAAGRNGRMPGSGRGSPGVASHSLVSCTCPRRAGPPARQSAVRRPIRSVCSVGGPDELQSPLRWEPGCLGILNRCSSHICTVPCRLPRWWRSSPTGRARMICSSHSFTARRGSGYLEALPGGQGAKAESARRRRHPLREVSGLAADGGRLLAVGDHDPVVFSAAVEPWPLGWHGTDLAGLDLPGAASSSKRCSPPARHRSAAAGTAGPRVADRSSDARLGGHAGPRRAGRASAPEAWLGTDPHAASRWS